jgi:hypothetical protein
VNVFDHGFGDAYLSATGHRQPVVPAPDLHPHPVPLARPLNDGARGDKRKSTAARVDPSRCGVCGNNTPAAQVLADLRRYAQLTLDSCSVERAGMAEDVLAILGGAR